MSSCELLLTHYPSSRSSGQITIGIGNEVRESTIQLTHMVRTCSLSGGVVHSPNTTHRDIERCVHGNGRHPRRDVPPDEHHGGATRLPVAVVHRLSRPRLLVLHRRLVVSPIAAPHSPLSRRRFSSLACHSHIIICTRLSTRIRHMSRPRSRKKYMSSHQPEKCASEIVKCYKQRHKIRVN